MPTVYLFVLAGLMYRGSRKKPSSHPDTLLVLGAKVKGKPAYPSQMLKERLDHAVHVHKCYPESQIIVSGGQGPDESEPEAVVMKRYLIAQGIPSTCIRTEVKSSRTKENLLFSQKRFGFNDLVIIICFERCFLQNDCIFVLLVVRQNRSHANAIKTI